MTLIYAKVGAFLDGAIRFMSFVPAHTTVKQVSLPWLIGRAGQATIVFVEVYFLFRLLLEGFIARDTFTFLYGIVSLTIGLALVIQLKPTPVLGFFIVYISYLLLRFMFFEKLEYITAVSLFQYLVPLMFFPIGAYLWRHNLYTGVLKLLIIGVFLSAVGGLANYYMGWGNAFFQRSLVDLTMVDGLVVNRAGSLAGISLGAGFLAATGILISLAYRRWKLLLMPVLVFSLLITYSRGAVVMLVLGVCTWIFVHFMRARWYRKLRFAFWLVFILLVLVCFFVIASLLFPELTSTYLGRYASDMFNMNESGNFFRLIGWQTALAKFSEHPILGAGYGVLSASAANYYGIDTTAESYLLKVLGELGIIGLLLYLLIIARVTLYSILGIRNGAGRDRELAEVLLACTSSVIVTGLVTQNIEYDFFAVLFWFFMGGLAAYAKQLEFTHRNY